MEDGSAFFHKPEQVCHSLINCWKAQDIWTRVLQTGIKAACLPREPIPRATRFCAGNLHESEPDPVPSHLPPDKPVNKSLYLEFWGFVTVTGVVGRWLGGLTRPLYPHFLISRSLLSILGHAEGLLLVLSSGQELTGREVPWHPTQRMNNWEKDGWQPCHSCRAGSQ